MYRDRHRSTPYQAFVRENFSYTKNLNICLSTKLELKEYKNEQFFMIIDVPWGYVKKECSHP
jgi:hypothetical protein